MGTYKLSDEAEDDLTSIHRYGVRLWGVEQADLYYWQFIEHFNVLAEDPLLYNAVDHIRAGYRRSVCGKHAVYYRIRGEVVEIMAIIRAQDIEGRL